MLEQEPHNYEDSTSIESIAVGSTLLLSGAGAAVGQTIFLARENDYSSLDYGLVGASIAFGGAMALTGARELYSGIRSLITERAARQQG